MVLPLRRAGALRTASPRLTAVLAVLAAGLALAAWFGVMQRTSRYQHGQIVDTPIYEAYADRIVAGQLPYRDFPVEYPPLAVPVFLVPRAVATDREGYRRAFGDTMGLLLAAAAAAVTITASLGGAGPGRALAAGALVAIGPAIAGSVALTRFDLWPTAIVAVALLAAAARRDATAGALLGLGAAAKLWPVLCLPPLLAVALRRGGRRGAARTLAAAAAAAAVPFAVVLAISPSGLWHALSVQGGRPLQVESLAAAGLAALWRLGVGGPYAVVSSSGSQNLGGSLASALATASTIVGGALILAAWVVAWRRVPAERDDAAALGTAVRLAFASVAAALAFGKVLSPQFVLWLLPFPLLVAGRRGVVAAALTVTALALTQAEFPHRYWDYAFGFEGHAVAIVLARDLVLVALAMVLLAPSHVRRRGRVRGRRV